MVVNISSMDSTFHLNLELVIEQKLAKPISLAQHSVIMVLIQTHAYKDGSMH